MTPARRPAAQSAATVPLRTGSQTAGVFLIGRAFIRSIGGYIDHMQFALGAAPIPAGSTSKLVPKR